MYKKTRKMTNAAAAMIVATVFVVLLFQSIPPLSAVADRYTYTNQVMFRSTYAYPEVVFVEYPTGDIADASTGISSAAETWEGNDITATQHGESDFWTITTPPLPSNKEWVICICDAASVDGSVETDDMKIYFYSPSVNRVVDSSFPSSGGGIYTRQAPMQ